MKSAWIYDYGHEKEYNRYEEKEKGKSRVTNPWFVLSIGNYGR
jgi:hypothetical protein